MMMMNDNDVLVSASARIAKYDIDRTIREYDEVKTRLNEYQTAIPILEDEKWRLKWRIRAHMMEHSLQTLRVNDRTTIYAQFAYEGSSRIQYVKTYTLKSNSEATWLAKWFVWLKPKQTESGGGDKPRFDLRYWRVKRNYSIT